MSQRTILLIVAVLYHVSGFSILSKALRGAHHHHSPFSSNRKYCSRIRNALENEFVIQDLKIPLLRSNTFLPLPSSHLPDVLATLNVYNIPLETALDRSVVAFAVGNSDSFVGHVCMEKSPDSWIGAVGCVSQVLEQHQRIDKDAEFSRQPIIAVCEGKFRFVVKDVLQEIPFPVVLVEEFIDPELSNAPSTMGDISLSTNEDEEDEDNVVSSDPAELISRIIALLEEYCEQQLDSAGDVSPLEQVILEETGNTIMPMVAQELAMEKSAIVQVFRALYLDNKYSPKIMYATSLLAAEMADFSARQRQTLLEMTNTIQRLVLVHDIVNEKVGMARARKMADQFTAATDEASKDLQIGQSQLPPWAKSIRKGAELEYFWNEEFGWCRGSVMEDPVLIVDEILLSVRFEDGETHRLPFSADEKVRWRPPTRL